jgi:hypothetical protein
MQVELMDFIDVHPSQIVRFCVRSKCSCVSMRVCDHGVVSPGAMIVGEDCTHIEHVRDDPGFFFGFALCCCDGIFMRIECATGKGPRSTAVSPCSTQLKKYMRRIEVRAYEQQTGCSMETPMAVSAGAKHPPVTVAHAHRGNGDTEGTAASEAIRGAVEKKGKSDLFGRVLACSVWRL